MNKYLVSTLLIGTATLGSAWLVRPDGTGDIERTQAMTVLGLDEMNRVDQLKFRSLVQNNQLAVRLVRNATYEVPCTNDGGATTKWFQRSQSIDANLLYRFNGTTKGIKVIGYGDGVVQNNVKCPTPFVRVSGGDDYLPAVMVKGSQTITIDGTPITEPMRLP